MQRQVRTSNQDVTEEKVRRATCPQSPLETQNGVSTGETSVVKATSEQGRMYFHHARLPFAFEFVLSSGLGDFAQPTTRPHHPSVSVVPSAGNGPMLPWALTMTSRKEEQRGTAWSSHSNSSTQLMPCGKAGALLRPCHTQPWRLLSRTCPSPFHPGGGGMAQDLAGVHTTCLRVSCLLQCFEILVGFLGG